MKNIFYSLMLMIYTFIPIACETKVSPEVEEFLGPEITEIVLQADVVESYMVKSTKSGYGNNISGYAVLKKGRNLNSDEVKAIKSILMNKKSYLFGFTKRSPFRPEYAFRFKKNDKSVDLLICLRSELLMYTHNNRELLEDFDPVRNKIKNQLNDLFK